MVVTPEGRPIAIDNGRQEFWQTGQNLTVESVFAIFDDQSTAYQHLKQSKGGSHRITIEGKRYSFDTILGLSPDITYIFNFLQNLLRVGLLSCLLLQRR